MTHKQAIQNLESRGWKTGKQWGGTPYCWKRSEIPARRCETNYDKHGIQIVATQGIERWDVDVTGELDGEWYKLMAYAISPDELVEKIDAIEERLVRAWNSLTGWEAAKAGE